MMMISMLVVLTAVPSVAQYVRRPYSRPVASSYRSHYTTAQCHRSALDGYFGLRIGLGVATVNGVLVGRERTLEHVSYISMLANFANFHFPILQMYELESNAHTHG